MKKLISERVLEYDHKVVFHFNPSHLYALFDYLKEMEILIYTLAHPDTKEIRYVGITSRTLNRRLWEHCNTKAKTHTANWIRKLRSEKKIPLIELLTTSTEDKWSDDEKYWISQFRVWGFNLTNTAEGGQGGRHSHSDETKKKMSETRKGRKYSWGDKISAALKGTRLGKKRGPYKKSLAKAKSGDHRRKVPKPSFEQLMLDLEKHKTQAEIAKKYQVGKSIVYCWFKFYKKYGTEC